MRINLLCIMIAFFCGYAYVHWFRALCFLIVLMGVVEHPDMPKNIMDIQGLNPWNLLFFNVLLAWLLRGRRERPAWDMPRVITVLLLLYLGIVLVGFFRAAQDLYLLGIAPATMVSEYLINTIKWTIPGLLLFDGCRDLRRLRLATGSVLAMYGLLALQTIWWMPASSAVNAAALEARSRKIIANEIGYSRVNMSMMLSGASWAVLSTLPLARSRFQRTLVVGGFLLIAYAQALTGGRMGYATWGLVGLILCGLRWRKFLLLIPVFVLVLAVTVPGVMERMLSGFNERTAAGKQVVDDYEVTAGRTLIWPHVINKITESPAVGFGRLTMIRSGLNRFLLVQLGEAFDHPHNAYLEWLLDNGLIGFLLVMPFYLLLLRYALGLFLSRTVAWYSAVGGMALALVLALLVAGLGSQTFYPREGAVGMWCAIGLMLRMHVEKQKADHRPPRERAGRRGYRDRVPPTLHAGYAPRRPVRRAAAGQETPI